MGHVSTNKSYLNLQNLLYSKNSKLKTKHPLSYVKYTSKRLFIIQDYSYLYNLLLLNIYNDVYYFFKKFKLKKKNILYYLILTFHKSKLFINVLNFYKKNYTSVSTGLFIKFFEKKKSLKKNKSLKLLMAKYLRKLFLISKIKNLILFVKKSPLFLIEIINLINQPIAHKFIDPLENRVIEENDTNLMWIKFLYFIFLDNKSFTKNKLRKRGRVKRKIYRKIIFGNKVID